MSVKQALDTDAHLSELIATQKEVLEVLMNALITIDERAPNEYPVTTSYKKRDQPSALLDQDYAAYFRDLALYQLAEPARRALNYARAATRKDKGN